jgi:hypothetical protein
MSIQPNRPLLDALRASLHKAEAKRILRERIAELESTARVLVAR